MKAAMETNFWGPIRVTQGALPSMRAQKSGTIVSISSIFGFYPCTGGAMYCIPKAAQDMLQGCLKQELASFNIRPITITAGLYRTEVYRHAQNGANGFTDAYLSSTMGQTLEATAPLASDMNTMPGDPEKFGARLVDVVDGTGYGAGLEKTSTFLFGKDAVALSSLRMAELSRDHKATENLANSTDFEGHTGRGVGIVSDFAI